MASRTCDKVPVVRESRLSPRVPRSDIWAFGAVLYEMVTGQKAFQGKSYTSLVGAILSADPPPMSVKPFTPSWLERLVKRCLQKDPEDRWQSMRDIVIELRTPPQESAAGRADPARARQARWMWIAALVVALIAGLVAGAKWLSMRERVMPAVRFAIPIAGTRDTHTRSLPGPGAW